MTSSADAEMRRVSAILVEMRIKVDQGDLLGAFAVSARISEPDLSDEKAKQRGAMMLGLSGDPSEIRDILKVTLAGNIEEGMARMEKQGYVVAKERRGEQG